MRRSRLLSLILLVLVLAVFGAYTAYWLVAAGRIKDGVVAWAQSVRAQKLDIEWQTIRVAGFPFVFRVELEGASLHDPALTPAPELQVPVLSGRTWPWDLRNWQLAAPSGLTASLAAIGTQPQMRLAAQSAGGSVAVPRSGGATISMTLDDSHVDAGVPVTVGAAELQLVLPATPAQALADPDFTITARLRRIKLPVALPQLGDAVDTAALAATVRGVMTKGPPHQVAAAWRDAGGTIEVDRVDFGWGPLDIKGSGTLALDPDMQPMGSFSGTIAGYDQVMAALVASGRIKGRDAGLVRLALDMMAKNGPDGRPTVSTSFTIQGGQMFLGPARLGPAPRIAW